MSATVTQLRLKQIETNGGTQLRAKVPPDGVDRYADVLRQGGQLPPVTVFHDGTRYWLADGFLRYGAHAAAGCACLLAEVRQGTQRDAQLYAAGANEEHGYKRTPADKRNQTQLLLTDEEWSAWSDREVARCCKVSPTFVGLMRHELETKCRPELPAPGENGASVPGGQIGHQRKATRNGTTYTMNTSRIGKSDLETREADALEARRHSENRRHLERIGKRLSQCAVELRALDGLDADEGRGHLEALQHWVEGQLAAVPA